MKRSEEEREGEMVTNIKERSSEVRKIVENGETRNRRRVVRELGDKSGKIECNDEWRRERRKRGLERTGKGIEEG